MLPGRNVAEDTVLVTTMHDKDSGGAVGKV
jgi:hypothetical protein